MNKATAVGSKAALSSFDVSGISSQILGTLKPKLNLTPEQVPQVTSIVTELLNKKKNALPMMASNKAGYNSVMSGIQSAFPSKMKTVLKAQQYATLLGLMPKFAALATIIPQPVIGGATTIMFGMVGVAGIQMLSKVDFSKSTNMMVVAVSLGLGLGITMVPDLLAQTPSIFK